MSRRLLSVLLMAALLLALSACSSEPQASKEPAAADSGGSSKKETPAKTDTAQAGASGACGSETAANRWEKVQEWTGTYTAALQENKEVKLGLQVSQIERNQSASGTLVFGDPYAEDDRVYWMGGGPATSMTVDDTTTTQYYGDAALTKKDIKQVTTLKGSGPAEPTSEDGLDIDIANGTYALAIGVSPIEVEQNVSSYSPAGEFINEIVSTGSESWLGGSVSDLSLPKSGFVLSGTGTTANGTVLTWELKPSKCE